MKTLKLLVGLIADEFTHRKAGRRIYAEKQARSTK